MALLAVTRDAAQKKEGFNDRVVHMAGCLSICTLSSKENENITAGTNEGHVRTTGCNSPSFRSNGYRTEFGNAESIHPRIDMSKLRTTS